MVHVFGAIHGIFQLSIFLFAFSVDSGFIVYDPLQVPLLKTLTCGCARHLRYTRLTAS